MDSSASFESQQEQLRISETLGVMFHLIFEVSLEEG